MHMTLNMKLELNSSHGCTDLQFLHKNGLKKHEVQTKVQTREGHVCELFDHDLVIVNELSHFLLQIQFEILLKHAI